MMADKESMSHNVVVWVRRRMQAGQSMKCFRIRHLKNGVETDACCVLVVGFSVQGM
jgi:hypothetical protein